MLTIIITLLSIIAAKKDSIYKYTNYQQIDSFQDLGKKIFFTSTPFCCGFLIAVGLTISLIVILIIFFILRKAKGIKKCPSCGSKVQKNLESCNICGWKFNK